ncbi:MAG: UDP-N-acetylglucosamine acyltransferase [Jatrophihabitantaceae bacterium]
MNDIHPTAVIGEGVELGADNVIGAYVVILGPTTIGDGNWIGPHTVLGTPAEVRGIDHGGADDAKGGGSGVRIGSGNVIRELSAVQQGHHDALTSIGDECYLMDKVHIGHDCVVGNRVTMAPTTVLAGHVHIGDGANLGMGTIVHQRKVIGPVAMIGMGSIVTKNVPPYGMAFGNPCRIRGANRVGMQRAGVAADTVDAFDTAYAGGVDMDPGVTDAVRDAWRWWQDELAQQRS